MAFFKNLSLNEVTISSFCTLNLGPNGSEKGGKFNAIFLTKFKLFPKIDFQKPKTLSKRYS